MPFLISRVCAPTLATPLLALAMMTVTASAQEGRPPSPVGVVHIEPENIEVTAELPGRIAATMIADVRPRVGGIIESRDFQQGSLVKAGDVLFRLDRATYDIAVEAASAAVARAEAVVADAQSSERRATSLRERNAVSQADYESAVAAKLQATAALAEARAQLRSAQLNLDYTEIRAPISGRTGRALITEGALVSAQGDVLTTIQQLDPVYADMQQPVSELLGLRKDLASGKLAMVEPGVAKVVLILDDGTQYAHPGKLLFAEAAVERSSGQVTLRAEFPNPEGFLLPGMYVRVVVEQAAQNNAIAIPSQAVQRDPTGAAQVYILDPSHTAQLHPVTLGRSIGNRVIVENGLKADDIVIVDGFQKMGPGAPVAPVCWKDPSGATKNPEDVCAKAIAPAAAN